MLCRGGGRFRFVIIGRFCFIGGGGSFVGIGGLGIGFFFNFVIRDMY